MAKKSLLSKIKITYNAPVTLTFALISALILLIDTLSKGAVIPSFFTAPGNIKSPDPFNPVSTLDYLRLFSHVLGHTDWNHFLGNMAFILLLGPVIEERYGSVILSVMMTITALVTGVLNVCFSPAPLLGSSDIAFMMILLASFTSISKSQIPLSFILILILYIGREILGGGKEQNISTLAHIAGGICGSLFAFLATPRPKAQKTTGTAPTANAKSIKARLEEIDRQSPRFADKKNKTDYADSESTVIGSIEL